VSNSTPFKIGRTSSSALGSYFWARAEDRKQPTSTKAVIEYRRLRMRVSFRAGVDHPVDP
jgi:hypothetical protein